MQCNVYDTYQTTLKYNDPLLFSSEQILPTVKSRKRQMDGRKHKAGKELL